MNIFLSVCVCIYIHIHTALYIDVCVYIHMNVASFGSRKKFSIGHRKSSHYICFSILK